MSHEEAKQYAAKIASEVWRNAKGNKEGAMKEFFRLIDADEKLAQACYIVQFRHVMTEQQTRH